MEDPATTPDSNTPASSRPSLPLPPWLGALIGAAIGAGAWAAVLTLASYEHGLVAWAIGGLVGGGAKLCGGRGSATGVICAVLALGSITAGKAIGWDLAADAAETQTIAHECRREAYDALITQANALAEVDNSVALKGFLIEYGYTEATSVPDVSEEDMRTFADQHRDGLREVAENPPTYDDWRELEEWWWRNYFGLNRPSGLTLVIDNLEALDLLFIALGMYTAAKLGGGQERPYQRGSRGAATSTARKPEEDEEIDAGTPATPSEEDHGEERP